ncbi:MAG: DUF7670 domain-containing protein [Chloroflexota bacterium]
MGVGRSASSTRARTSIRWLARILAVLGALLFATMIFGQVFELRESPMPFVLDGAPLGTYAQPTQLMLLTYIAANVLFLVGAVLVFPWEATAARVLLAAGVIQILLLAKQFLDSTFPRGNLVIAMVIAVLPPLVIGGLLLAINRRAQHARSSTSG